MTLVLKVIDTLSGPSLCVFIGIHLSKYSGIVFPRSGIGYSIEEEPPDARMYVRHCKK